MFKNLKRAHAISRNKKVKIAKDIPHTEEGRAIIEADIKNYNSVISPYSVKGYRTICSEFSNHIYTLSQQIPLKEDIEICLYTDNTVNDDEKSDIAQAIKTHYAENIVNNEVDLRRVIFRGATFAFIGLVIFAILILFVNINSVWFEMLGILGWVLLWDSIEEFLYEIPEKRAKKLNYYRLTSCKIVFKDYDEMKK